LHERRQRRSGCGAIRAAPVIFGRPDGQRRVRTARVLLELMFFATLISMPLMVILAKRLDAWGWILLVVPAIVLLFLKNLIGRLKQVQDQRDR
jgi:Ca2+/Na+ antiporter